MQGEALTFGSSSPTKFSDVRGVEQEAGPETVAELEAASELDIGLDSAWSEPPRWPTLDRMQSTGAYNADRAAALSGVPRSTVHYWARTELIGPSVSGERVKLWSYGDLVALRVVYWLRQRKTTDGGAHIPATSMKVIRRALGRLHKLDSPPGHDGHGSVWVDGQGELYLDNDAGPETVTGQAIMPDAIDLIAPFTTQEGLRGPNLASPRPQLRIAPGRLSGSPHVVHTRLETRALFALHRDGLDPDAIRTLYPYVSATQVGEAIDLERQLEANLAIRDVA